MAIMYEVEVVCNYCTTICSRWENGCVDSWNWPGMCII